jgi:uncharacterized membrane protein
MNPLNPRTVIFAKHAQHVVIIHFPIALFITGVVFDFIAEWTRRKDLAFVAYCSFCGAVLTAVPAIVTGLLAWQWDLEGRRLKGILLMHLVFGCLSAVLIAAIWWLHSKAKREANTLPAWRWFWEVPAVALVALTAHLGGFLSGVNHP